MLIADVKVERCRIDRLIGGQIPFRDLRSRDLGIEAKAWDPVRSHQAAWVCKRIGQTTDAVLRIGVTAPQRRVAKLPPFFLYSAGDIPGKHVRRAPSIKDARLDGVAVAIL